MTIGVVRQMIAIHKYRFVIFVISGYVITSSLAGRESKNFLDFLSGFYERRIKRLVPALVVFVLITSVLISLFNPDPGVALGLGWRSLFGVSNIDLYRSATNYFAESTELNPFTHTWSLGVEEQFYLLFPFLIWFSGFGQQTAKGARNLFFWVGALTIASLISFIYLYQVNQPAAYFLMPPRFWEMAAGCLLFIGFQKRAKIEQALWQVPPLLVVAAMVGVMFLPVSAAVPATIGVVVLSAVLIACLKKGTCAYKFFTLEKVVYIGLISYSLYLWHWTVLSISRWTIGIHWWSVPIQAGLMLLMAIASYRWVETPLRKRAFNYRLFTIGINAACLTISAGALIAGNKFAKGVLFSGRYAHQDLMTRSRNYQGDSAYNGKNCHLHRDANQLPDACQIKGSAKRSIYFVGNSHTDHYRETHYLLHKELGFSIDGITVSSCEFPPRLTTPTGPENGNCGSVQEKQSDRVVANLKSGDIVAISNRYTIDDQRNGWLETKQSVESVNDFSAKVIRKGGAVILFGPLPEFQTQASLCTRLWFRPFPSKNYCERPLNEIQEARMLVRRRIKLLDSRILIYNPIEDICTSVCKLIDKNNKPVFVDGDHLTDYANRQYIYPSFKKFLATNRLI